MTQNETLAPAGRTAFTGLPAGLPAGYMRCTAEKYPRVLYASSGMLALLGMTEEDEEWREMICTNLFFMLPFEDRHILRGCLERAGAEAVSLEHRLIRKSGGHRMVTGWLRLADTEAGQEYHFAYMLAPAVDRERLSQREAAYLRALQSVYDMICSVDREKKTMECIHQSADIPIGDLRFLRVILDGASHQGLFQQVFPEDRERLTNFLMSVVNGRYESGIRFGAQRSGRRLSYEGVAVELDERTALLCFRQIAEAAALAPVHGGVAPVEEGGARVFIRTFGYFDVFVDGQPMVFCSEKSKELLAVLVDRQGSFVSNPYIINCLWEDEPYSEKIQNRCRQVIHRLMQTLREHGVEDIIERAGGRKRIVPERVRCDYFEHIRGAGRPEWRFNGAYLSDYSWGEVTLSNLIKSTTRNDG